MGYRRDGESFRRGLDNYEDDIKINIDRLNSENRVLKIQLETTNLKLDMLNKELRELKGLPSWSEPSLNPELKIKMLEFKLEQKEKEEKERKGSEKEKKKNEEREAKKDKKKNEEREANKDKKKNEEREAKKDKKKNENKGGHQSPIILHCNREPEWDQTSSSGSSPPPLKLYTPYPPFGHPPPPRRY